MRRPARGTPSSSPTHPVFDRLWSTYPHTTLNASGPAVGLPPGQMGNSEVGHLTIGSGRVPYQDLVRINKAIETGEFFSNDALRSAFARARERGANVHLLGLVSYGGVHSHMDHLRALLELAEREGMSDGTWIHAFTDGRDVSPTSAVRDLAELPVEKIATVVGRYYAMDRDQRWDRTERALASFLTGHEAAVGSDPVAEVQRSYDKGVTDEFIEPIVLEGRPRISEGDALILFNFRPDRMRQLTERLLASGFDVTTMTRYRDDFDCPVAFPEQELTGTMAEVLAEHGVGQLHVAETEKYAHVTYFFNGGEEEPFPGEVRILGALAARRPELRPEAGDVRARGHRSFRGGDPIRDFGFAVRELREPGHGRTHRIDSRRREGGRDRRRLPRPVSRRDRGTRRRRLVTADHGNAEQMLEPDGRPHTAHTTNPVPFVFTDTNVSLHEGGELATWPLLLSDC